MKYIGGCFVRKTNLSESSTDVAITKKKQNKRKQQQQRKNKKQKKEVPLAIDSTDETDKTPKPKVREQFENGHIFS
jgi:hypothetical protein